MLISSARSQMHLSFSSYVKMNIRKIGNDFFDPGMIKRQILIGHHFRGQLNAGHNIVDGARVDVQLLRLPQVFAPQVSRKVAKREFLYLQRNGSGRSLLQTFKM
jgi:hypothetical protein